MFAALWLHIHKPALRVPSNRLASGAALNFQVLPPRTRLDGRSASYCVKTGLLLNYIKHLSAERAYSVPAASVDPQGLAVLLWGGAVAYLAAPPSLFSDDGEGTCSQAS